jgi:hypothetical protein
MGDVMRRVDQLMYGEAAQAPPDRGRRAKEPVNGVFPVRWWSEHPSAPGDGRTKMSHGPVGGDEPSIYEGLEGLDQDPEFSTGRSAIRIASVAALGGLLFGYDSAVINGAVSSIQKTSASAMRVAGLRGRLRAAGCGRRCDDGGPARRPDGPAGGDEAGRRAVLISAIGTASPDTSG